MSWKAVLFDMDGVLIDSEEYMAKTGVRALKKYGIEAKESDFAEFVGCGENRYVGGVAEKYGVPYRTEMKDYLYACYGEHVKEEANIPDGVLDVLHTLRSRGYKLAVCSSADRVKVLMNLDAIGAEQTLFDHLVTGTDIKNPKPDPEIYQTGAASLGLAPDECIVVEDAPSGIRAAHADRDHAQSSGIRRVRIGPDHHAARESVIFEHDLVDDARSRAPESESVAVRHAAKEVVHLAIRLVGRPQVVRCAPVGQNQVVAMDRGGNRRTVAAGVHELQQSHLGRSVLHGDPVGAEVHIVLASAERSGRRGVEQVGVQDFFGQCQRSAFGGARAFHLFAERAVDGPDQFDVKLHDITGFKILKPGIPVRRRSDSSGRLPRNAGVLRNADVDSAKINILLKNILSVRYFSRMAENLGSLAVACLDDERDQLVGLFATDDESVFVNVFDQY